MTTLDKILQTLKAKIDAGTATETDLERYVLADKAMEEGTEREHFRREFDLYEYIDDLTEALKQPSDPLLQSPDDRDRFLRLLNTGVDLLKLTEREIARQFGVSRPTIERWHLGTSAPHPVMRPIVFKWLKKRAEAALP